MRSPATSDCVIFEGTHTHMYIYCRPAILSSPTNMLFGFFFFSPSRRQIALDKPFFAFDLLFTSAQGIHFTSSPRCRNVSAELSRRLQLPQAPPSLPRSLFFFFFPFNLAIRALLSFQQFIPGSESSRVCFVFFDF